MTKYRHTNGHIQDSTIGALLHDSLFRQRVEKKAKGKGSYQRKDKHAKGGNWPFVFTALKSHLRKMAFICMPSLIYSFG